MAQANIGALSVEAEYGDATGLTCRCSPGTFASEAGSIYGNSGLTLRGRENRASKNWLALAGVGDDCDDTLLGRFTGERDSCAGTDAD